MVPRLLVFCMVLVTGVSARPAQALRKPKSTAATSKVTPTKDLLDQSRFPGRYLGYVVLKAANEVILWFQGTWEDAPTIVGGGSGATWSRRGARLKKMDALHSDAELATSFNLGQQDGRWLIRMFRWEPDPAMPGQFKPAPHSDEGTGEAVEGSYRFDLEKYRIVLFPREAAWKPTTLRVIRFLGDDFAASAALAPSVAPGLGKGPTQLAPVWAAGSYLLMEDGPLGRMIYRGFAEQGNTWVVRYAREGTQLVRSAAEPYEGSKRTDKGTWAAATLYANGVGLGKSDFYGIEKMSLDLAFRDPAQLEEVRFDGRAWGTWGNPSMEFTLHGTSTEVAIPDAVRTEVLSRCADPQWLAAGGPYSPQKLLNLAFQGCYAQGPRLSLNPAKNPGAEMANEKNKQGLQQALPGWTNAFQECGIRTSKIPYWTRKPAPLGLILTPEQVEKLKAERTGQTK